LLSYEKVAELWKKDDIAVKYELGSHLRKKSSKKSVDHAAAEGHPSTDSLLKDPSKGGSFNTMNGSLSDDKSLTSYESEWRNQLPPIRQPKETAVTAEDVYFVISKVSKKKGSLIGGCSDYGKFHKARLQWKLS
jgi:hypothetical protein